jgi:CRP-like cAMP-binding protein
MAHVSISSVRRSAECLRSARKAITVPAMARISHSNPGEIRGLLDVISGLSESIGYKSNHRFKEIHRRIMLAVQELGKTRQPLTRSKIVEQTGLKYSNIKMFLTRHPDLTDSIDIVSQGQANREKRANEYKAARERLISAQCAVTFSSIARESGYSRFRVSRDVKRDPALRTLVIT